MKQIEVSDNHYFALTKDGLLYGWGSINMLGCGTLKDVSEREVFDIVNPIELMKNVEYVSTNKNHTIVVKKDGQIFAWGLG